MSNYQLKARPTLDNYSKSFNGLELKEITHRAMVSMSFSKDSEASLKAQLNEKYQIDLPEIGKSATSNLENTQFLRLQEDLCFVLFDYDGDRAVEKFAQQISDTYLSDQSDSWVMLKLSGSQSREVLERTCPIDLHHQAFNHGSVARTVMEHIGSIIVCEGEDEYTLMALRSYGRSFLHMFEVSISNVLN